MEFEAVVNMLEMLSDAVLVIGKDSIVEYANNAACNLFSLSKSEIHGLTCDKLYESDKDIWEETIKSGNEDTVKPLIKKIQTKDYNNLEIKQSTLKTDNGIKIIQIVRSITKSGKEESEIEIMAPPELDEIKRSINILPLPVIVTNNQGIILYFNPAWKQITGYSLKDLLNTTIHSILDKYLFQGNNKNITFNGSIEEFDNEIFIIKKKNKQQGIFSVHISVPEEKNMYYVWLIKSVSNEDEAKEEIKQREEYLKSIFRAAPIGIGVTINRVFYFVNKKICEITGYSTRELLGKSARLLYPDEEEYQRVGDVKYDQISKIGTGNIETCWKCKDGGIKNIFLSSTPIEKDNLSKGVTFTALDITRRKKAESESLISEKKYRSLIETAADAIFVAEAKSGIIVEVNKKACELIGRKEEEIIGMHQSEIHPSDLDEKYSREFKEVASLHNKIAQTEVLHKSGLKIPVEINPSIYTSEQGDEFIIGFFRDLTPRFEWQKALQESELKFKVLFETAREGIVLVDQQKNKFEYVNPAMCEFLEFTKDELLNKGTRNIHDDKEYENIERKIQQVLDGEQHSAMNIPCRTKTGKKVYADVQATYISIGGVKYTAAFYNNITRRREIEQKLRIINKELKVSQKNYRRLFDELISGFAVHQMIYDDKGNPTDYRFLELNPAFEKLTGLKADDILNKTVKEILPDIENSWIEKYGEVAKTGKPIVFQQYAGPLKKHYEVTAYSPGKDLFATIFTDVTSLIDATRNLALSEERYRELVENSPNILVVLSGNKFLYANPTALRLFGYKNNDELKNVDPYSHVHPDYKKIAKERIGGLKPGVKRDPIQVKMITRYGEERIMDGSSIAIHYDNKPASLIIGVDVTDKVNVEHIARKTQSAIENIQKGIASKVGEKFFETIVTYLTRTLKADYGFVGELVNGYKPSIETVSVIDNGKIVPNIIYELKDTPCEDVLRQGLCSTNRDVTKLYPRDQMLIDLGIQGYVGVPLKNAKGVSAGVMVALFKEPIEDTKYAETILEIFSVRAGAEIERRKSEKELEKANMLFKTITQNIPDIILRVDRNFHCIYVSPHVDQLAGISAKDFIGRKISEFDLRAEFTDNREREFAEVLKSKSSYQTVLNVNTAQDRKILEWRMVPEFDEKGDVSSILNIIRDITDLRRTENELNRIFNLSADLICILNTEGHFLKINPAFESILGYSEQEILATRIFDLIHPDDIEPTVISLQEKMIASEGIINLENRIRCKDGSYKWISWVTQSLGDENLVYVIARDISSQRKTIKELTTAKEKAEESDRLKSTFLANMSHEIRTPMNAIMGFAMLLQRQGLNPDKIMRYTEIIRHRSDDLLHIINDILDISKIELEQISIVKEDFSINNVFNELFDEFSEKLKLKVEKSINFRIENYAKGNYQKITNDILRFKQVLTNLIDNAIKFTSKGYVRYGCKPNDSNIIFYVADSGIGIPLHKQKDVFERFRQVDESITREFGGNGLGLAISKALVELMGGEIWLESKESVGTTFFFSLPIERTKEPAPLDDKSKDKKFNLAGKRILVVEDDPLSIEFFRIVLEEVKADVTIALNGGEALIIFEADTSYDLILMDIQLPDINGYEVTRRIRKLNNKVPIIAQTAFAMAEDRIKSLEAGCNEYLSKPILSNELLEVISAQLQKTKSY
jgi:PAS domain S-box-containing protein